MTTMNIEESRKVYNSVGEEYERYYFDEVTGGFVLIHQDHNTTNSEVFVTQVFAKLGKQVKLLSEQTGDVVKTPDAEIDGELWKFKELKNAINVRGATQRDIRNGRKQARNIAYHINQDYNIDDINRGIESAIRFDPQQLVEKITLIFNDETLITLTREELDNGKRFA
jgi:hypothetical protein